MLGEAYSRPGAEAGEVRLMILLRQGSCNADLYSEETCLE